MQPRRDSLPLAQHAVRRRFSGSVVLPPLWRRHSCQEHPNNMRRTSALHGLPLQQLEVLYSQALASHDEHRSVSHTLSSARPLSTVGPSEIWRGAKATEWWPGCLCCLLGEGGVTPWSVKGGWFNPLASLLLMFYHSRLFLLHYSIFIVERLREIHALMKHVETHRADFFLKGCKGFFVSHICRDFDLEHLFACVTEANDVFSSTLMCWSVPFLYFCLSVRLSFLASFALKVPTHSYFSSLAPRRFLLYLVHFRWNQTS